MMNFMTRRGLIAGAPGLLLAAQRSTEIRVVEILRASRISATARLTSSAAKEVDRVTLLNVDCVVESRDGKRAKGFAAMSMGNVWAWPSRPVRRNPRSHEKAGGRDRAHHRRFETCGDIPSTSTSRLNPNTCAPHVR
jgi:hypothetical protein